MLIKESCAGPPEGYRHISIGNSVRMCGGTHLKSSGEAEGCKVTKIKCSKNKEGKVEATIFYSC